MCGDQAHAGCHRVFLLQPRAGPGSDQSLAHGPTAGPIAALSLVKVRKLLLPRVGCSLAVLRVFLGGDTTELSLSLSCAWT